VSGAGRGERRAFLSVVFTYASSGRLYIALEAREGAISISLDKNKHRREKRRGGGRPGDSPSERAAEIPEIRRGARPIPPIRDRAPASPPPPSFPFLDRIRMQSRVGRAAIADAIRFSPDRRAAFK